VGGRACVVPGARSSAHTPLFRLSPNLERSPARRQSVRGGLGGRGARRAPRMPRDRARAHPTPLAALQAMRLAPLWLMVASLAVATRAQLLPPLRPLPNAAALADALEAGAAAVDDRSHVTLNSTVVDLGSGGTDPAPALGPPDSAACAAACAAAPGCYAATWLERESAEGGEEETECLLFGGGATATPSASSAPACPTLQLTTAGGGTTHLFPGAFTAAAAPCAGAGGGAAATARAAPLPALCARFPRLCPPPAPGGRRRLTASPRRDAGAVAWGLAVDARGGAAAVHGVAVAPGPPSTAEYLGSVANVASAIACEGYCQLMQAGADNGDGGAVPITPFASAPGADGLARLAVAATGALQAHCVVSTWHRPGGQGEHSCDLWGLAPAGPTTLVLRPSPSGAGATTGVRAGRWSALADYEEAVAAATAAAG